MSNILVPSFIPLYAHFRSEFSKTGMRVRPGQSIMMDSIAELLQGSHGKGSWAKAESHNGKNIRIIQAPTGNGKTFGYSLPALAAHLAYKRRIVISTANIGLQDQIVKHDLPWLLNALGVNHLSVELVKGRHRFLCPEKLNLVLFESKPTGRGKKRVVSNVARATPLKSADVRALKDMGFSIDDASMAISKGIWQAFSTHAWDGDFDTLSLEKPEVETMQKNFGVDRFFCMNKSCPSFKICPYMGSRARWQDADILVANHDWVLRDATTPYPLFSGGKKRKTSCDENVSGREHALRNAIVIFDEGHHVASKAADVFTKKASRETFDQLQRALDRTINEAAAGVKLLENAQATRAADTLRGLYHDLSLLASRWSHDWNSHSRAFVQSLDALVPAHLPGDDLNVLMVDTPIAGSVCASVTQKNAMYHRCRSVHDECLKLMHGMKVGSTVYPGIDDLLESWQQSLRTLTTSLDDTTRPIVFKIKALLARLVNEADEIKTFLTMWMKKDDPSLSPIARWMRIPAHHRTRWTLTAKPTFADEFLPKIFQEFGHVVLTSATLEDAKGFDFLLRKLGLNNKPDVITQALPSPFDYTKSKFIECQTRTENPNHPAHIQELAVLIPAMVKQMGRIGNLVLCTSKSQMRQLAAAFPPDFRALCKIQDVDPFPLEELKARHVVDVTSGKTSVLMGMAKLAEGANFPGVQCEHVLITKLPFPMFNDPDAIILKQWVERNGGNSFTDLSLPEMVEALLQWSGRLVRTETDTGFVTLFDNRLTNNKSYGPRVKATLPLFQKITWTTGHPDHPYSKGKVL